MRWAPDGSGVTLQGTYVSSGVTDLHYVDLSGRIPGSLVQLSAVGVPGSDLEGDVQWLPDASGVVYRHEQDRDCNQELFLASPPTPMAPVKINAPFPADTGTNTIGVTNSNSFFITRDGDRVVARGDVMVDNDVDVFIVDLHTAPSLIPVSGPPAPGGDIDWILLHHYEPRCKPSQDPSCVRPAAASAWRRCASSTFLRDISHHWPSAVLCRRTSSSTPEWPTASSLSWRAAVTPTTGWSLPTCWPGWVTPLTSARWRAWPPGGGTPRACGRPWSGPSPACTSG